MLSYRQFIEEQRKAGRLSSILATLALAIHGGKQLHNEITNPGHIQQHYNIYSPSLGTHVGPEEIDNLRRLQRKGPSKVPSFEKSLEKESANLGRNVWTRKEESSKIKTEGS